MKQYISLLLLILLVPALSFAQGDDSEFEEYEKRFNEFLEQNKSSEEEAYYKNREYKEHEPLSMEVFSNYYNDFFKFTEVNDYTPYNDTLYITPYQDSVWHLGMNYWWC